MSKKNAAYRSVTQRIAACTGPLRMGSVFSMVCVWDGYRNFDTQYMFFLERSFCSKKNVLLENAMFSVLFYVLDFKNLVFCVLLRSFESVLNSPIFSQKCSKERVLLTFLDDYVLFF